MNDSLAWLAIPVLIVIVAVVVTILRRSRKRGPAWDIDETDEAGA